MGDLTDNESIQVDAEGEGILGEFTFTGKPFEGPRHAASSADEQEQKPELVGVTVDSSEADLPSVGEVDSQSQDGQGSEQPGQSPADSD